MSKELDSKIVDYVSDLFATYPNECEWVCNELGYHYCEDCNGRFARNR